MNALEIAGKPAVCPVCTVNLSIISRTCIDCGQSLNWFLHIEAIAAIDVCLAVATALDGLAAHRVQSSAEVAQLLQRSSLRRQLPTGGERVTRVLEELSKLNVPYRVDIEAAEQIAVNKINRTFQFNGKSLMLIGSLATIPVFFWLVLSFLGEKIVPPKKTALLKAATPTPAKTISLPALRAGTVMIRTKFGMGTGFLASEGGYILSNGHVMQGVFPGELVDVEFYVGSLKQSARAVLEKKHPKLDLALLRCNGYCANQPPLVLGRSTSVEMGSTIYILGNPFGLDYTLTKGIISNTSRFIDGVLYLQTDASVNPGNSGGPAVNESGEVIGITTAKANGAEGIGFILPIDYAVNGFEAIMSSIIPPSDAKNEFGRKLDSVKQSQIHNDQLANVRSDPFEDVTLPVNANLELLKATLEPGEAKTKVAFSFRIARKFDEELNESTFQLIVANSKGDVGVADLGQLEASEVAQEKDDTQTKYTFDLVGEFPASQVRMGDSVAVVWNGKTRSLSLPLRQP